MTALREQMKMNLELKGYSPHTQKAYLRSIEKFAQYYGKSPEFLNTEEIKAYLHRFVTIEQVSSSYVHIVYSALKFLYETTLERTWEIKKIPRTKQQKTLPVLLSPAEIKALFHAATNPKHQALLMTLYGAGLRSGEAAALRIADIDSQNMQIRVRQAKGKKDRYTLLSIENLKCLRTYWSACRPSDWLFPGLTPDQPMTARSVSRVFEQIKNKAGIQKEVSAHTLRHCFATHLLESGTSVYHIQHLLGHASPRTTSRYIHLTRKDVLNVKSPLDTLIERNND